MPELGKLLSIAEKPLDENPYEVIEIGRGIWNKLTGEGKSKDDWTPLQQAVFDSDALSIAASTFEIRQMDPFQLLSTGQITKDAMDAHVQLILDNDEALQVYQGMLEGDRLASMDPVEAMLRLQGEQLPPERLFTTDDDPALPDEVKIQTMRKLAAGILLYIGYEIARTASESGIEVNTAIDVLAMPLCKALNAAYLVKPPGANPDIVEGAQAIMQQGVELHDLWVASLDDIGSE